MGAELDVILTTLNILSGLTENIFEGVNLKEIDVRETLETDPDPCVIYGGGRGATGGGIEGELRVFRS